MAEKMVVHPEHVRTLITTLSMRIQEDRRVSGLTRKPRIWGVPRGGIPVAMAVVEMMDGVVAEDPSKADIFVDDILDSGATMARYAALYPDKHFYAMINKKSPEWADKWIVLPWEVTDKGVDVSADDIILRLLQYIGEDPTREGLQDTPRRVLKAWKEWAKGYGVNPADILKTFKDGAENCGDEFVIVRAIPIVSKCEHHLADITGVAHIGYIPNGKIVGLSKLVRVADLFARRLQVQERLTNQIADALVANLEPKGVGVVIHASHACMSTRGVGVHGSITTTSAMRGVCLTKPEARHEFLTLCEARG